jgi:hypothetical protein
MSVIQVSMFSIPVGLSETGSLCVRDQNLKKRKTCALFLAQREKNYSMDLSTTQCYASCNLTELWNKCSYPLGRQINLVNLWKELGDLVSTSSLSLSEYKLEITIGQMPLFYRTGWNTKRDTKEQESRELRLLLLPQSSWNPKVWMAMTSGCRQLSMISWRSFDYQVVLSTGLDEDAYKLKSY